MRWGIAAKITTVFSVLILVATLVIGTVITDRSRSVLIDAFTQHLSHTDRVLGVRFKDMIETTQRNVAFLARVPAVQGIVRSQTAGGIDPLLGTTEASWRKRLSEVFRVFLESRPDLFQVRFIGTADNGRELVRVERQGAELIETPNAELQQKAQRDYFKETIRLAQGELYVSRIELNREWGKVVVPHLPVVRIAAPVYDEHGQAFGIIVVNMEIRYVFQALSELSGPEVALYITNMEGDYLYHPDPLRTFGFDRGARSLITDEFPDTQALLNGAETQLYFEAALPEEKEPALAYFERLPIGNPAEHRFLLIGVVSPRSVVLGDVRDVWERSRAITLVLGIVAVLFAMFASQLLTRPLTEITRAVSRFGRGSRYITLPVDRNDEIGVLAKTFQGMATRINEQIGELEDKGRHLKNLFDTAVDCMIVIDDHGQVETFNPAAERLFGYAAHEVLGHNVRMLMPEPDREGHDQYLQNYLKTGERRIIGIGREVVGLRKDGLTVPLYLSVSQFQLAGQRKFTGILHDISEQKYLVGQLRKQAALDPLTNVHNRRYYLQASEAEFSRSSRHDRAFVVILLNLDELKQINRTLGRATGETALKSTAATCRSILRDHDILGRLGEEEFAITLPETDLTAGQVVTERLRKVISETEVLGLGKFAPLSLSLGIAMRRADTPNFNALLNAADKALHKARDLGRNRINAG